MTPTCMSSKVIYRSYNHNLTVHKHHKQSMKNSFKLLKESSNVVVCERQGPLKLKPVVSQRPNLLIIYIKLTFAEFTLGSVIVFFPQFCITNRENGISSTLTKF